jgi:hypothetical protein
VIGPTPKIEFLWWSGCPSWPEALRRLRVILEESGLDPDAIEIRQIETGADAARAEFVGSPTIRIDGEDVQQPPPPDEHAGLTCRIYRLRDGRISPLPDPADVRDALSRAIEAKTREGSRA